MSRRACIVSVAGTALSDAEIAFLSETRPFGVILMGRSCESPSQVRALTDGIRAAAGAETWVLVDQEGGRVRRLRPPAWPAYPAPAQVGRLWDSDPEAARRAAWLLGRLIAADLEACGIDVDCAPNCDLAHPGQSDVIGDRSFGPDPAVVAALAGACANGLRQGGVHPIMKHLPGHGRARTDSHDALPRVDAATKDLAKDWRAFDLDTPPAMGMTCHVVFVAVDDARPATHSPDVIGEVIRGRIGFEGLLMTDDIGMNALGGALAERSAKAIAAGCDIVLHCAGFEKDAGEILDQMREIAAAVPELAGESAKRADRAARTLVSDGFDVEAGRQEFDRLLGDGPSEVAV